MEPEAAALILLISVFFMVVFVVPRFVRSLRRDVGRVAPVLAPPPQRPSAYDWDRRTHQAYRKIKGITGASEQRDQIVAFLDTHEGSRPTWSPAP